MKRSITLLICLAILLVAGGITWVIFSTEPSAERSGATKETAMLVEVTEVETGTFRPTIEAMGTVRPSQDIVLSPRVSGEIVERSPGFVPGGYVEKGEVLLRIDPADYRNALEQRRSELRQAKADLALEMGRQRAAEQDYSLINQELPEEQKDLVLREPQLNSAMARVESAQAAVEQAELNLQRTEIKAPFNAHILARNANVGSQVSPGEQLGRLVGREEYWVESAVPLGKLRWIEFPKGPGEDGSPARVRNRAAWPEGAYREGSVYRLIGTLEEDVRMARVLVTVPDPLAFQEPNRGKQALMIGSFVETLIEGQEIEAVARLNRDYLRKDDAVWVMEDGKLSIRSPEIVFRDARYAYVASGLDEGEQVVTTNLATPTEGAALRVEGASSPEAEATENAGDDAVEDQSASAENT